MLSINDLLVQARAIKQETVEDNNSAGRIGSWMELLSLYIELRSISSVGVKILDVFSSVTQLPVMGKVGDAYSINENIYIWSAFQNKFVDAGRLGGDKGNDGNTPYIKDGNWWIDGIDTGVAADAQPWTPIFSLAMDGSRYVQKLTSYVGGSGAAPTANIGQYLKSDGTFTSVITEAATYTNAEALSSKVDKGGSDKTLKQVEDEIVQLAGEANRGWQFRGFASPSTVPIKDLFVFYIARSKGIYSNFDNIEINEYGIYFLYYDANINVKKWLKATLLEVLNQFGTSALNVINQGFLTDILKTGYRFVDFATINTVPIDGKNKKLYYIANYPGKYLFKDIDGNELLVELGEICAFVNNENIWEKKTFLKNIERGMITTDSSSTVVIDSLSGITAQENGNVINSTVLYNSFVWKTYSVRLIKTNNPSGVVGYYCYKGFPNQDNYIGKAIVRDAAIELLSGTTYVVAVVKMDIYNGDHLTISTENLLDDTNLKLISKEREFRDIDISIQYDKVVDSSGNIVDSNNYDSTHPLNVEDLSIIDISDMQGKLNINGYAFYSGIPGADSYLGYTAIRSKIEEYTFEKKENAKYLVICINKNRYTISDYSTLKIRGIIAQKMVQGTQEACGIYLYPFRTLAGQSEFLFKESIVSGLKPLHNYEITCARGGNLDNYSKRTFKFEKTDPGTYPIKITVKNTAEEIVAEKQVAVDVILKPDAKLDSKDIKVFFVGDSLWGYNQNKIGEEFLRMLTTEDSESHVTNSNAIQLPTLNICRGNIELIGENGTSLNKYQYVYHLNMIMNGKRASAEEQASTSENPFYNPNSSEPDELDDEGFNKRVDFKWYFQKTCGQGSFPNLFYLAIGANDIAAIWNWQYEGVEDTAIKLLKVIKRIKKACDEIAGEDSNIVIKIVNHQTYPLYNMRAYNFPIMRQRLIWEKLYSEYFNRIYSDQEVNKFVEIVDCASRFDWENGYYFSQISVNKRYNGMSDVYSSESVHMNTVGSYNYADCLITDFIADSRFD